MVRDFTQVIQWLWGLQTMLLLLLILISPALLRLACPLRRGIMDMRVGVQVYLPHLCHWDRDRGLTRSKKLVHLKPSHSHSPKDVIKML